MSNTLSFYIVGEGSLTVRCAQMVIEKRHRLEAVVSDSEQIRSWCLENSVEVLTHSEFSSGEQPEVDYLCSVVNFKILPPSVLRLGRKGAINFHDGPLPRYAGLNVTTWALLNGDDEHAITWHLMEEGIDGGAILLSKPVPVSHDTALTLNAKCFEAGVETFPVLLDGLMKGDLVPVDQDVTERRYFGRGRQPDRGWLIDPGWSAEEIERVVRALSFGSYPNPIGLPKFRIDGALVCVGEAEALEVLSSEPAGTIVAASRGHITISTTTSNVALRSLVMMDGTRVLNPADYGLVTGASLEEFTEDFHRQLSEVASGAALSETYWLSRLKTFEASDLPFQRSGAAESAPRVTHTEKIPSLARHADGCDEELAALALVVLYVGRLEQIDRVSFGFVPGELASHIDGVQDFFLSVLPATVSVDQSLASVDALRRVVSQIEDASKNLPLAGDILIRQPELEDVDYDSAFQFVLTTAKDSDGFASDDTHNCRLVVRAEQGALHLTYDPECFVPGGIERIIEGLRVLAEEIIRYPDKDLKSLSVVDPELESLMLREWNKTDTDYPADRTVHELIEAQAQMSPNSTALLYDQTSLTYGQLNQRANQLANYLVEMGVAPGDLVGVCTDRSADMVVSVLATMKAGAAYVPLDPEFPRERIRFMVEDADIRFLLTQTPYLGLLPSGKVARVILDTDREEIGSKPAVSPGVDVSGRDLCYVIYTSGSTGRPKGVMIEHHNVANFFVGMDRFIGHDPPGTWLAVTSLSFDISVLELLWTLARGFKVVLYDPAVERSAIGEESSDEVGHMDFSLFYFASDEGGASAAEKYGLLIDGAKFADEHGFSAVWTPERHFHAFGGLYPNPSVAGAAIATITDRIAIRAGSCVSPLHSSIRIAEEWAVVDNLSNGRVGISFAAGWQPNDFVLMPDNFADRKQIMFRQIDEVLSLWRGESIEYTNGKGEQIAVRTLPRPVQAELPVWITAAGNPDTFRQAGLEGYNILTHLLGQTVSDLAEKIRIYRNARSEGGHKPEDGNVCLMLHTFVGEDIAEVKEIVREPMKDYLKSSIGLIKQAAWSFPTFKTKTTNDQGSFSVDHLDEQAFNDVLEFSFERYFESSGLFGTVDSCLETVDRLRAIGVDEIACLIDYGIAPDRVKEQLPLLNEVRSRSNSRKAGSDGSIAGLIHAHGVTHMQCTPSMAALLIRDDDARQALSRVRWMMVGGEALPSDLANDLCTAVGGEVLNMYGPTETTIWSTIQPVAAGEESVPIGLPIANTQLYVLDKNLQLVPPGVRGELFIGGEGVARGYLNRAELTDERFVQIPWTNSREPVYRTGDLVEYRDDGVVDFIGRADHQVKIRGYRIELGEIESLLRQQSGVSDVVAIVREDVSGDKRLVAYVVIDRGSETDVEMLRQSLEKKLPSYMVPAHIVVLDDLPLTPNKKIDRKALPQPTSENVKRSAVAEPPSSDLEVRIADIWQSALKVDQVGVNDSFFDLGGHSLLALQVHSRLNEIAPTKLTITDLFRFPTVRSLANHLAGGVVAGNDTARGSARAAARREARRSRNPRQA